MKLLQGILVMSIPLLLLQCSKENEVEVEPVAEEEPAANIITDPFYADLNDKSTLLDYWELFVKDAIRSGKPDPGAGRVVSVFFGNEPDFASGVTADHAGRAFNICDEGTVSFEIIKSFWEDFSIPQRLYTFYHEAGHARYKYRHPCESFECTALPEDTPIMWLSVPSANTPFENFLADKENFFKRRWDGVRYFNCEQN
ncbi:MAG: hypothetical protein P8H38_08470 [Flavobacteriaceae bacterium]|nr:hypothetical protein [Flavobacteriaceae bacterium]